MPTTAQWIEPLIPHAWREIFSRTLWDCERHCATDDKMEALLTFVGEEYDAAAKGSTPVYPPQECLFAAFSHTAPEDVRVVNELFSYLLKLSAKYAV